MTDRKQLYIGQIHARANAESGIGVYTTSGYLSACGNFVEQFRDFGWKTEPVRHPLDHHWQETPEAALAVLAPKVRAIGERLIRQAAELEAQK
jgi:hypothetical protein